MDQMVIDRPPAATARPPREFSMTMVDPTLYQESGQEPDVTMEDDVEAVDDATSNISADSDARELRAEVARFDLQQEAFVARQRAEASGIPYQPPPPRKADGSGPGGGGAGGKRKPRKVLGPRKAAKLSPDIQFRMSLANEAFQQGDYDKTIAQLGEIIRINSEVFNAWTLLSTVHETLGNREQAIWCRISAAHLTPRDVPQWISTAEYALECVEDLEDGSPEREEVLRRAYACYTQALETDRSNIVARTGRADVIMMLGNASKALAEYQKALNYKPWNIRTVRNIADVALDAKDPRKSAEVAKGAYRRLIDHLQASGTFDAEEGRFEWSDLRIYLEFFGILEQWHEGAQELKEIARWLLGRREETYWDQWVDDDREWDVHEDRRIVVPGFEPTRYPLDAYGQGLPVDLRAKLFVYRSRLGFEYEANLHLALLDPTRAEDFMDFPDCLKDIAVALLDRDRAGEAIRYLDLYRHIATTTGETALDADFLVSQGRYHMASGDKSAAEECFIAAIEEDEDHIEARVQLANMYEGEQEQEGREEAFLLVREAMNLEASRGDETGPRTRRRRGPYKPRVRKPRKPRDPNKRSRYVPRRLINAEKRKQQDLERTAEAAKNFQLMQELQERAMAGDEQAKAGWMRAAKELVDDFRSYKQFYPWEKYIKYLGYAATVQGQAAVPARNMKLAAMEERLRQNLAPVEGQDQAARLPIKFPSEHRGIPFDTWLDVFLNYAFALVRSGQHREAYVVCHAARDSVVWTSPETTFLIHVAWASCAVYAGDEETCVAIARYFMRDYMPGTDSYRMFSAMCRVCQTPVSWYTSGPAQKFILRQIKTMDTIVMKKENPAAGTANTSNNNNINNINTAATEEGTITPAQQQQQQQQTATYHNGNDTNSNDTNSNDAIGLDVALLTIYGHILFTTTSYTYALSYFARAASLDPDNCLINLSTGLAYVHYALKRQATNRQYLLTQGFAFLYRYYRDRLGESEGTGAGDGEGESGGAGRGGKRKGRRAVSAAQRQEAHFNMARAYSLIGLGNLAVEYYLKVLAEEDADEGEQEGAVTGMGSEDLKVEAAYNIRSLCYLLGDVEGAKAAVDKWLVLE
ncbi:hypothetical protein VTK26DRAFT_9118 [Humicola hyalothermophila]